MGYGVRRDMHEVKSDLKLIKWGVGLIIAAEVMPLMKIFLHSLQEFYDDQDF